MKICLISDTVCDANGVSRFIQNFAKCGENDGFWVLTATKKKRCQKLRNIENANVFFKIKMPFYKELDLVLPDFKDLKAKFKAINPDVVVISTPGIVGLMGLFLARKSKKAAIYHTDFPSYIYKNTKSKLLKLVTTFFMHRFYKRFDLVFLRSFVYEKILTDEIKIDADKLRVLKAGIDTKRFDCKYVQKIRWQEYNISQESFKLLYTGRLSSEKNFDFLLETFQAVKKECEDAVLVCCGEGSYLRHKKELEKEGVFLLGYQDTDALCRVYASCDLFVFPSTTDTLGQVVMEAQMGKMPVLVSDKGGPKSLVQDGKNGYVLPLQKQQWVQAIQKLHNDKALLKQMAENAYTITMQNSIKETYVDFKTQLFGIG
jgi:glycosyltransferase involved in cell wall biosynthesis